MKKLIRIQMIMVLFIMALCSTAGYAQHNHGSHEGHSSMAVEQNPHGGVVQEAGKYRVEMVVDLMSKNDKLSFYLLKANLKSIPAEGITGTITFNLNDGTTVTENLVIKGDDRFVAQLEDTDTFECTVKFFIKGKTVSAIFIQNGLIHNMASKFTCPMHPEIESDGPGKCPKCGMNLVKE